MGLERGVGYNVNVAWSSNLDPPMSDAEYLAAFRCLSFGVAFLLIDSVKFKSFSLFRAEA